MNKAGLALEKRQSIIRNSLHAYLNKKLSETPLSYEIFDVYGSAFINENWMSGEGQSKIILQLKLALTAWATGNALITADVKLLDLDCFLEIEKLNGIERINSFEKICRDKGMKFYIAYDSGKIFEEIKKEISKRGREQFKILNVSETRCKMRVSLTIKKNYSMMFQLSWQEEEVFLKALDWFAEKLKEQPVNNYSDLNHLVEKSPLKHFWIVNSKDLKLWAKESKSKEIPIERLSDHLMDGLFRNNPRLEHVVLPEGLKEIPPFLFARCINLKTVLIPESVEEIEKEAFYNCPKLREINFPRNLKRIAPKAFAYCENLFIPSIPTDCDVAENAFLSEWDYDPEEEVL